MSLAPHPVEPDEHRRARHLHTLKSLTERGLALAYKAADCAEAQLDAPPAQPPTHNPHQNFERYARTIRLLITAEHRIANPAAIRRPYRVATLTDDPRRPQLRTFLHQATRSAPDRAALRRELEITVERTLERDPAKSHPAAELLSEICEQYGLPFDITKLPDDFLELPVDPPEPAYEPSG